MINSLQGKTRKVTIFSHLFVTRGNLQQTLRVHSLKRQVLIDPIGKKLNPGLNSPFSLLAKQRENLTIYRVEKQWYDSQKEDDEKGHLTKIDGLVQIVGKI